jgi:hypothetical protein
MDFSRLTDPQAYKQALASLLRRGGEVTDFIATAPEKAGQAILEGHEKNKALQAQAFANPNRPFQVTNQQAMGELGDRMLAGPLSVAPVGMTRADVIKKAFEEQSLTPIYHGTSPESAKAINKSGFDVTKSADGTIWFTSNPKIGEVAATGKGAVIKKMLDEKSMKLGGWDEIDKYSVDELLQKGFDGVKLKDSDGITYQIFNPEKLTN